MFFETIKMAFLNVTYNKMRSFLTVLGVLIGVASIIALTSIVQGVTEDVTSEVLDMGATTITAQVTGDDINPGLKEADLKELSDISNIKSINPSVSTRLYAEYDGDRIDSVTVNGVGDAYFTEDDELLAYGRPINVFDVDQRNKVAIIGSDIVEDLFYGVNPLDKEIKLGGITYTIVGVLEVSSSFMASSSNSKVIVPYTTAMDNMNIQYINSLEVNIVDENLLDTTTQQVESKLLSVFDNDEDSVTIINMDSIVETVEEMTGMMSLMLGGVAAISLLVGGIGIMNMMLVTVTERTKEIGLRKALGAKPSTIQLQFILEALFLSILGGFAGLVLGLAFAYAGTAMLGVEFVLVSYAIPLAFGFSGGVGLIFGYWPAKKASELNPMDALRTV